MEIARRLQEQTWQDAPCIPLGRIVLPAVVRRNIEGVLPGVPKFWNVRRAA